MTTAYSILATVTLQHDYYANGRCADFDIVPSAETASALSGAGMLTKNDWQLADIADKGNGIGRASIYQAAGRPKADFLHAAQQPCFYQLHGCTL